MPLERSVDILLRLIAQSINADIAVLSNNDGLQKDFPTWVSVPLEAGPQPSELFLGWTQRPVLPDISSSAPLIDALKLVVARNRQEHLLHELLAEAARLQWKLADSKIADRTAGLIASGAVAPADVQQHVQKVLASVEDMAAVSSRVARLNSELQDRDRISAAKTLLQHRHAFTEEQAYVYLQQLSRRSRRTIAEIAVEVCRAEGNRRPARIAPTGRILSVADAGIEALRNEAGR
jgi:hypothetical protein